MRLCRSVLAFFGLPLGDRHRPFVVVSIAVLGGLPADRQSGRANHRRRRVRGRDAGGVARSNRRDGRRSARQGLGGGRLRRGSDGRGRTRVTGGPCLAILAVFNASRQTPFRASLRRRGEARGRNLRRMTSGRGQAASLRKDRACPRQGATEAASAPRAVAQACNAGLSTDSDSSYGPIAVSRAGARVRSPCPLLLLGT